MIRIFFTDDCGLLEIEERRLRHVLTRILADHDRPVSLSVAFIDDAAIREIHRQFLGKDQPTDVISFPLEDADGRLRSAPEVEELGDDPSGEIIISVETALREAAARDLAPEREVALYAIHGALHLVGYDDLDPDALDVMRRREEEYLEIYDAFGA